MANNQNLGIDDTIAAISTPVGEGGISIVRMSGSDALEIADRMFVSPDGKSVRGFATHTVRYGHIIDHAPSVMRQFPDRAKHTLAHETIDEALLTVMRAPKSYTKEDIVEINCHGGMQAAKKTLELAVKYGARVAEPGEFTKRAFLSGRIDLVQAEGVLDVIRSKTEGSLKVAMSQLGGELSKEIDSIREEAIDMASQIEADIDFPEEEVDAPRKNALVKKSCAITDRLKKLSDTYDEGMIMREGLLAIICGKPNVGKSSLMNLLLKRDRVIVSPIPGTTRDAVEEFINLRGMPIRLVDTAGIAETKNVLDGEGIKRSRHYIKMADIALLILDASTRLEKADLDIIKILGDKKKIIIINKCDLKKKIDVKKIKEIFKGEKIVEVSVGKKKNIALLEKAVSEIVHEGSFVQGESAVVSNARHKALLDKAHKSMLKVLKELRNEQAPELISLDLREAISDLGFIIGKSVSDDILNRIFERFCIGK